MTELATFLTLAALALAGACLAVTVLSSFSRLCQGAFGEELLDFLSEDKSIGWLIQGAPRTIKELRAAHSLLGGTFYLCMFLAAAELIVGDDLGNVLSISHALAFVLILAAPILHYGLTGYRARLSGTNVPVTTLRRRLRLWRWLRLPFIPIVSPLIWFSRICFAGANRRERDPDSFGPFGIPKEPVTSDDNKVFNVSKPIQQLVANSLMLRHLVVRDIMLPRTRVQYFDLEDTQEFNLQLARRSGHTRFPLCSGDLDHCLGMIHIKDIFRSRLPADRVDLRTIRRKIVRIPATDPLDFALEKLLKTRTHMALVEDKFGGVAGILTLEQILEELVGEIQDEFDTDETMMRQEADGSWVVSGLAAVHDVEETLGIEFSDEDSSTLGGLISAELGRIPAIGDELTLGRVALRVDAADTRRVISLRLRILPDPTPDEGE